MTINDNWTVWQFDGALSYHLMNPFHSLLLLLLLDFDRDDYSLCLSNILNEGEHKQQSKAKQSKAKQSKAKQSMISFLFYSIVLCYVMFWWEYILSRLLMIPTWDLNNGKCFGKIYDIKQWYVHSVQSFGSLYWYDGHFTWQIKSKQKLNYN